MQLANLGIVITVKSRYNAFQGTEPGEHYKRESAICGISFFAGFLNLFPKKKKKPAKRLKKRVKGTKAIEKSYKKQKNVEKA